MVVVARESACGHSCENCGGCAHGGNRAEAEADNAIGARVGDRVRIEMSGRQVVGLAAVVYLFPLVTMFAGYAAFSARSEAAGIAGAGVGLLVGAALLYFVNWWVAAQGSGSRIVEILDE